MVPLLLPKYVISTVQKLHILIMPGSDLKNNDPLGHH